MNYVDDCAFPVLGKSAEDVIDAVQLVSSCILDSFAAYLMHCTLASNKTAIILGLLGKYQRKILRDPLLFEEIDGQMTLRVRCRAKGMCNVPVIKKYKHVGRMVVADCSNNADVSFHVMSGHTKFSNMAHNVIGNKSIPVGARLKFSLIPVAKMLASSCAWYNLSLTSIRALDS